MINILNSNLRVKIEIYGAGGRDRTDITSLEGWDSTIELHPL